ncbi:MAG TPA: hypothetical protein VN788_03485 [Verrucomicrobiae bacterium]|nr:hypothetical protein [Verrucomicrobiae bacterium]
MLRPILIGLVLSILLCGSRRAGADVGLVLNDSLDTSVARITGSGHSAIYFSRICPETPIKMRLCRSGENGSVVSNYTSLGEDQPFEWNIVPLDVYLYGVANPANRPLFASAKIKNLLEMEYRERTLRDYCASHSCQTSEKAEWREMVSATSERTIYIFIVKTTRRQDLDLIAEFNAAPNVNRFNGFGRNCADFSKRIINTYFPHATHRDFLNDFGMTSPKAVARTLARYAHHHPELQYRVVHFAQSPGTIKHSSECRSGTEQLYRSKKLLVPMAFFAWHELPIAAGSYLLTGRFNPEREFERHASVRETSTEDELKIAESDYDKTAAASLKKVEARERTHAVGTPKEWAAYREEFDSMVSESASNGLIPGRESLNHVFRDLNERGKPFVDDRGGLWMEVDEGGETVKVGLSPSNVLAPGSNRPLAYQMILAHIDDVLKSSPRRRETIPEFQQTWGMLQQVRAQLQSGKGPALAMKR